MKFKKNLVITHILSIIVTTDLSDFFQTQNNCS